MKTKIKNLVFTIILVLFTNIIMADEVKVILTETENGLEIENWMVSNWDLNADAALTIEPWMVDRRFWKTDTMNYNRHFNKYGEKNEMFMKGHNEYQRGEMSMKGHKEHQRGEMSMRGHKGHQRGEMSMRGHKGHQIDGMSMTCYKMSHNKDQKNKMCDNNIKQEHRKHIKQ
jgi:hypothetical protein